MHEVARDLEAFHAADFDFQLHLQMLHGLGQLCRARRLIKTRNGIERKNNALTRHSTKDTTICNKKYNISQKQLKPRDTIWDEMLATTYTKHIKRENLTRTRNWRDCPNPSTEQYGRNK